MATSSMGETRPQLIQELDYIATALKGIRYGSVEITIHDSRVVQVERKEKLRLERDR